MLSIHKGVTIGLPAAIASNIFLVRTNVSAMKWVASIMEDAKEIPSRAKICGKKKLMTCCSIKFHATKQCNSNSIYYLFLLLNYILIQVVAEQNSKIG